MQSKAYIVQTIYLLVLKTKTNPTCIIESLTSRNTRSNDGISNDQRCIRNAGKIRTRGEFLVKPYSLQRESSAKMSLSKFFFHFQEVMSIEIFFVIPSLFKITQNTKLFHFRSMLSQREISEILMSCSIFQHGPPE